MTSRYLDWRFEIVKKETEKLFTKNMIHYLKIFTQHKTIFLFFSNYCLYNIIALNRNAHNSLKN